MFSVRCHWLSYGSLSVVARGCFGCHGIRGGFQAQQQQQQQVVVVVRRSASAGGRKYKFVDRVKIRVESGSGGKGCVSHESLGSYKRRADGGNGGHGGSVIIMADDNCQTLGMSLHHYRAADGTHGSSQQCHGKNGPHTIIRVPTGVLVQRILDYNNNNNNDPSYHTPLNNHHPYTSQTSFVNDDDNDDKNHHSLDENNDQEELECSKEDDEDEDDGRVVDEDLLEEEERLKQQQQQIEEHRQLEEQLKKENIESVVNTGIKADDGMYYWKSPDDDDNSALLGLDYKDDTTTTTTIHDYGDEYDHHQQLLLRQTITLADLDKPGSYVVVARGGRGGWGNAIFGKRQYNKNSQHKQLERAIPTSGESVHLQLELKLIADIGLIGQPNAGKSTLLAAMSKAKPRIAPYPFTTLHPLVGCIDYKDGYRVLAADVPGLIEGASSGRGKGLDFLKHLERTKALLYIVDASMNGKKDMEILFHEIASYADGDMISRPAILVANKLDLLPNPQQREELLMDIAIAAEQAGIQYDGNIFGISAGVTGEGLRPLSKAIRHITQQQQQQQQQDNPLFENKHKEIS